MKDDLEIKFNDAMMDIYRRAKSEVNYNAIRFLQMVVDHGGLEAAHILINADNVSDGYSALWERGRLDLTVEAMITENEDFHALFTPEQLEKCIVRLQQYGYSK